MATDQYNGPSGTRSGTTRSNTSSGARRWRMPATLPSGALVSNPGGPSTTFNGITSAGRFSAADFLPQRSFLPTFTRTTDASARRRVAGQPVWYNKQTSPGISDNQVSMAFARAERQNALLAKQEAERGKRAWEAQRLRMQEAARAEERRKFYADPLRNPAPSYTPRPAPANMVRAAQTGSKSAQEYVRDWNRRERERATSGGPELTPASRIMGLPNGEGIYARGADNIVRMWREGPSGSLISDVSISRTPTSRPAPKDSIAMQEKRDTKQRVEEADAVVDAYLNTLSPKERAEYKAAEKRGFWSRSEQLLRGVDTMLQRDRFAKTAKIADTGALAGKFSQAEMAQLIANGLVTYGKLSEDGYRQPVFSANIDALERFLDDNFRQNAAGDLERKTNQFVYTPEFRAKLSGSQAGWEMGTVYQSPRMSGVDVREAPTFNNPMGEKRLDYSAMATQYVKDEQAYGVLNSKIEDKIRSEGGGAVLDKIRSGKYTAQDVQDLKQYMYSFNGGPYVKAQQRWINEQLLGIGPQQFADAARSARDYANVNDLVARNAKEREKVAKEEAKAAAKLAIDQFENAPKEFWMDNLIGMVDTGVAGSIPRYALNDIFYSDVAKDQLKTMNPDQLARLQLSVVDALNAGAPVDPVLVSILGRLQNQVNPDKVAQAQDTKAAEGQSVWRQVAAAVAINPLLAGAITYGAGAVTGKDISLGTAMKTGSYNMTSPGGSMYRLMNDPQGPLSPENADSVFSAAFLDNAIKSPIRAMLGLPMGIYMGLTDPVGTGTAMLKDYGKRYGALWGDPDSNFIESSLQDPWAPAMDILGLVPVVGLAAKGTAAARIAAVTSKANGTKLSRAAIENMVRVKMPSGYSVDMSVEAALELGKRYGPAKTAGLRELERVSAELANKKPPRFVSAWRFADMTAKALAGSSRDEALIASNAPGGYGGLNSAYTPHLMDYVASWFEPRWKGMTLLEGLPKDAKAEDIARVGEAVKSKLNAESAAEFDPTSAVAMRRLAGSPLARGAQEAMYFVQREISRRNKGGRTGELLVNLPLTGFNFRFANALKSNPYGALDIFERELFAQTMHERLIQAKDMQDYEHLAVMSLVSGEMYSPQFLRQVQIHRLQRMEEAGVPETDPLYQLTRKEYDILSDPVTLKKFADTLDEINTLSTERGQRLAKAVKRERMRMDRMHHEAGAALDALSARQLTLRYQNFINAMRLGASDLIDEINTIGRASGHTDVPLSERMPILNGWWHMAETGGFRDTLKPLENADGSVSAWRSLKDDLTPEQYKEVMDRINASVDLLAEDAATRTIDKTPLIAFDRFETIGGRRFVVGRRVRISGEYKDFYDSVRRDTILGDEEVFLPEEWFVKQKNVGGEDSLKMYDTKAKSSTSQAMDPNMSELEEQLNRAVLNFSMKTFPDARDFVDKVSDRNFDGWEPFTHKKNENKIASSGLLSFRLETQWAAHKNALHRRFKRDIQETLERNAVYITRGEMEKHRGEYVPLRTIRVHDTKEAAVKYANNYQSHGAMSIDEPFEIVIDGQTKYVTRMNFLDTNVATLKEMLQQRFLSAEDWQKAMLGDLDMIDVNNIDGLIAVVPKKIVNELTESYKRSNDVASRFLNGYTKTFKLMALALNPRFVTQQVFGAMVMMMLANPMQAGHIMAKFLQYSAKKRMYATGKWKMTEADPFELHGDDYDIIMNRFIRDFEDNVYGMDAFKAAEDAGLGAKALKAASTGYVLAMAAEKNMRVAIVRDAAMHYPGFKQFMQHPDVLKRAAEGIPEMGYTSVSPFHAAMDLMSDPRSKHYDPVFLRELRHTADMVSGNYRDFTNFEHQLRNFMVPFYAWTRHSALYTKRMIQERPLTSNVLFNLGNYGYDKIIENGGLPDWLLESVPMPTIVEKVLGLDPEKDNRLGFGSISPFGTSARNLSAAAGLVRGEPFSWGGGIINMGNPLLETLIEQSTGTSIMSGTPISKDKRGVAGVFASMFSSLPPARITMGLFESSRNLNELRGKTNPEDIFKDPYNPDAGLSIPEPKLSQKFTTASAAGIFNAFAPTPAYSINPDQLGEAVAQEYQKRGVLWEQYKQNKNKGMMRTASALNKWKYKRDFIYNVWLPQFGNAHPDIAAKVLKQLEAEKPVIPKGFPADAAEAILSSGLRQH